MKSDADAPARKVRPGGDVCMIAVGKMVEAAEEAALLLDARGVHAAVWDVRAIPLDRRMLADARSYDFVITAEDGIAEGGAGATIVSALGRMESEKPPPTTITLGTPLAFLPARQARRPAGQSWSRRPRNRRHGVESARRRWLTRKSRVEGSRS